AARATQVVVEHDAVVDHQLRRHRAHRGGGRNRQRGVHVAGDRGRRAAQHLRTGLGLGRRLRGGLGGRGGLGLGRGLLRGRLLGLGRRSRGGLGGLGRRGRGLLRGRGLGLGRRCLRCRSGGRSRGRSGGTGVVSGLGTRGVVGEELVPTGVHRGGIFLVSLVHLLDQPLVLAELRRRT